MVDSLYEVEKKCNICGNSFSVTKVRSRLVMINQDTDFCTYYKGVNPYYYSIWVCPHCGYAAQDDHFNAVQEVNIEKIAKFLANRKVNIDLTGHRTREQAVNAYKLALFFADMESVPDSKIAGLYLRLAWVLREGEMAEDEQAALIKACEHYEKALYNERLPIGNMTEVSLTYLVGELLRRTGKTEQSLKYFSKVVSMPQAKMERRILEMSRNAWQDTKAEMKQAKA